MKHTKQAPTVKRVSYGGWKNCIRLSNGSIELIATLDVGPRIIRLGRIGGQNLFKEYTQMLGKTGGKDWRIYGGHRLWHAPEAKPRTYFPDNKPVGYEFSGKKLILTQDIESTTGIVKQMEITMEPRAGHIKVLHRLINTNPWAIEASVWCLSVMAPGGRAIVPNEPFRAHSDYLLPARPLVLWHYTDMADKRWTWGTKYIQLSQDPAAKTPQKCGLFNRQGWAAYALNGQLFVKKYEAACAPHPDFGCNTELFTNEDMLELETLGPLAKLEANGGTAEHTEHWYIYDVQVGQTDGSINKNLLPLIKKN